VSVLNLHVERRGSGPSIVLAHGFGGSARNFRPQLRELSRAYQVVAYDARGHARSPAPVAPAEYDESELSMDMSRVIDGVPGPVIVGGLSLGAYTALKYALGQPGRVRALILASFPSTEPGSARATWALGFADAIDRDGLERAGEHFVWGPQSRFDEGARALIKRGLLEHPPHALSAILRNVLAKIPEPDQLAAELSRLDVPVLVVVGAQDTSALAPCERLAALLPQAELQIVAGAGHVVNLAAPAEFNRLIDDFARRLPAI
jgi:pimeloyl-ACP methyl ester carboxylesterase